MAKLSQLQQAYENPNMRKMLNLIAASEGVKYGYNTLFGNQHIDNLSAHPNIKKAFKQTDGKTNYTTAAGRYQFLNDTWNGVAQQYGFKDFSPRNQDLGAIALIAQRGALNDVLKGDYRSAILKLGPEWASLPSSTYKQGKRSWDFISKQLGSDIGGNDAQQYQPQMIDLKSVGIGSSKFTPQYIDLKTVGIGDRNQQQTQQYQPEMIDLKSVGIG
ncbi:glycoside hydrolase family 24 protein [Acinetobacter bereziniae]|uniref:glycoside hydrolase family 24 protein n=1 Tax=Acinetobacter bereziniae TaxID=106648 RepID=UPI000EF73519|nr:glycoside hydrolase family 104 protein [Acinetobacter bereziniae]